MKNSILSFYFFYAILGVFLLMMHVLGIPTHDEVSNKGDANES